MPEVFTSDTFKEAVASSFFSSAFIVFKIMAPYFLIAIVLRIIYVNIDKIINFFRNITSTKKK